MEGCDETELASGVEKTLTVKSGVTKVVLKGNITELRCDNNRLTALNVQGLTALQQLGCSSNQLTALNVQGLTALQQLGCSSNQLTALNVQGLTALKELYCYSNKLTAQAFTKLFNDLPARQASDNAAATLYTEKTGETEGNHKDFSTPESLKNAFNGAKSRNWKMEKRNASGQWEELVVAGSAELTPGTDTIKVKAITSDGSAIEVKGCNETTLASGEEKTLTVKPGVTEVILKGKITELNCAYSKLTALNVQDLSTLQKLWCNANRLTTLDVQGLTALQELYCGRNRLTALNVQGCSALKTLYCQNNKLNADAFTKIFTDLPARDASDDATCHVYKKTTQGVTDDNCTNFTTPAPLKAAFDGAKSRNWKLQKLVTIGWVDI